MNRSSALLASPLILALAISTPARAGDGDAIPYPAQQEPADERGPLPAQPGDSDNAPQQQPEDYPNAKEEDRLSGIDDPGAGLSIEIFAAALFVEAARGSLVDARFGYGARLTWDIGRIFPEGALRQALFIDLQYLGTNFQDGTKEIFTSTHFNYLTIAPAYAFPFGEGSPYAFFLQLGGGIAIMDSPLTADGVVTANSGVEGIFQYGLGIRGRPRLGSDSSLRLTFRVDVTRFRRGYADDTYVGGGVGLGF
jgi:hypothetical protein